MNEPGPLVGGTLVFLGSGVGGLLRHAIGSAIQHAWGPRFPLGTLVVNVSGCLVMGLCIGTWIGATPMREEFRLAILIGVLGGYTTFSSFGRDFFLLASEGAWGRAASYALLNVVLSLLAVWVGAAIAHRVFGQSVT
ncbi:MAG: fluoride efflux transporter CrcB [Planctomycetes bacterium]|nr:fluoride efflux transporter CrcB [Planctomycetota bacterium]